MSSLERVWRGLLALTIMGTIPLSIWGSGCNSQPGVQPDASGLGGVPATGGVPGTGGVLASGGVPGTGGLGGIGGHSSGGSTGTAGNEPRDASADALAQCCLSSENGRVQCSADGRQRKTCGAVYGGGMPECFMGSYSYVWTVLEECPNGCVDPGAGGHPGTGGQPGTGGVSVPICQ
jgi:hypothetical protein